MELDLQDTQIQIGKGVHLTRKSLQGVSLGWAWSLCCGSIESRSRFL